jgi:PPOX class probable F420-dependent enzyme
MASPTPFDDAPYVSLRIYKRDGGAVDTPVWCAPLDGTLVMFTLRESYKVKRIRRNPHVQVARCDVRGNLLGEWHEGTCVTVENDPAREKNAYAALTRKYGMQMRIGDFFSALVGRKKRRVILQLTLS